MLAGTVFPSPSIPVDPERMVRGCQTIAGMHNYAPQDLLAATRFLEEEGRNLPWDALHEGTMCLDQSQEAFDEAMSAIGTVEDLATRTCRVTLDVDPSSLM